jgi:hypothetical protein
MNTFYSVSFALPRLSFRSISEDCLFEYTTSRLPPVTNGIDSNSLEGRVVEANPVELSNKPQLVCHRRIQGPLARHHVAKVYKIKPPDF